MRVGVRVGVSVGVGGRKEEESGREKVWSESEKEQGVTGALKVMCVCVSQSTI